MPFGSFKHSKIILLSLYLAAAAAANLANAMMQVSVEQLDATKGIIGLCFGG
tara:strand:+ start:297 stop:452 length:156 start_codon:yes stop_codon:yes gene_type:complete